jgi:hypothetical protein
MTMRFFMRGSGLWGHQPPQVEQFPAEHPAQPPDEAPGAVPVKPVSPEERPIRQQDRSFSVFLDLHLGQAGAGASAGTMSSNFSPQARQTYS